MSGTPGTRVAVLTPTLLSRHWLLEQAIASVEAQTFSVQHLVGVDEAREGPAKIRNRLAADSHADWYLPLDDDDLLDPECVELLLAASDGADVIYPWCRVEDHADGLEPWSPNRLFRPEPLLNFNYIPVTALVRAELWREVGGMPDAPHAEDWLFWKRCLGAGARFKCLPECLWAYRRGLSGSRNQWAASTAQ